MFRISYIYRSGCFDGGYYKTIEGAKRKAALRATSEALLEVQVLQGNTLIASRKRGADRWQDHRGDNNGKNIS